MFHFEEVKEFQNLQNTARETSFLTAFSQMYEFKENLSNNRDRIYVKWLVLCQNALPKIKNTQALGCLEA